MTDVLIVGAGPTGLVLACDLARRGVAVRIVDRSPVPPRTSRAKGPNPRSLEILDDLGVAEEVLAAGSTPPPMLKYRDRAPVEEADPWADLSPSPDALYDRPWLIAQWRLEEILRGRLAGYGVRVEFGREVVGLTQAPDDMGGTDGTDGTDEMNDADGGGRVEVTLAGRSEGQGAGQRAGQGVGAGEGAGARARYVVGCDGAHSSVRKLLGIGFAGTTREDQVMVCGDVDLAEGALDRGVWHQWFDEDGAVMLCPIPGTRTGWWFQAGPERDGRGRPLAPTADGFRRLLARHTGLPGGALVRAELLSTYRVNVRMADRFRAGRVFLAGDAAHVHPVAGGLGMNTGIQDAFNLGWKLGLVLGGHADPALLDTYEEERLPVAARTLDLTSERLRATLEAIRRPGGGLDAAITADTTGLDVGYRWSSLAAAVPQAGGRAGKGVGERVEGRRPLPGDRAPDAPCTDAATGARTRLHHVFAGSRTAVLGFGPGSAAVLREVAEAYGEAGVRTCRVYAVHENRPDGHRGGTEAPAAPCAVIDDGGHAAAAYGTGAPGGPGPAPDPTTGAGTPDRAAAGTDTAPGADAGAGTEATAGAGAAAGAGAGPGTVVVVRPDHHVGLLVPADDARSVREYLRRLHGTGRSAQRFADRFPDTVDAVR
ncbi:FAD-dependent monooxygenase [Streptomyces sp. NPDC059698]|uniref:FAD-dependent monooxygenase n=1 Tax=unclassified Streptomyces TaxID=2593676 RepID=UPI00095BD461|nr:FAD-dependent monooxygenase [Streptomyces sp. CB02366]OKJ41045.1 monooxygenase [Streptomyces sp. CB02366]